jgi:signal transduction histidine kinase
MDELLRLEGLTGADVFFLRQQGRELAAALDLDGQDQIRVATALSEVGRELLDAGPTRARFLVADSPARLVITLDATGDGNGSDGRPGVDAAARLLDAVEVTSGNDAIRVVLTKHLPRRSESARVRAELKGRFRNRHRPTPTEELRVQNADLVATLDALRQRQQDLEQLNQELEETNRGVVAMYNELSGELEETNRGVVALYAELDSKSQELAQANEAKTRFLRSVSHELRAPVNSILGLAGLLADDDPNEERRRQVAYLSASARSLLDLVNELLDLARAESGRLDVARTAVPLAPLFAELRGTLRPMAAERGLDLTVDQPAANAALVWADHELLARVLRNLLINALDFTERGQVRLGSALRSGAVEIEVADTGIGISLADQGNIFEEFFQVPGPVQTRRHGTGLGLPYARRATEALGGTISVASEPGRGSVFTVRLPVPATEPSPLPADLRLGHVLVVDDDAAFREVVRGMLQGACTRVSEASGGEQALHLVGELRPDVVLLDLRMPDLDGAGVLARLRADPDTRLRDVPVVLMTSVDIDAEIRRAAEPAAALLAKDGLTRDGLLRILGGTGEDGHEPGGDEHG